MVTIEITRSEEAKRLHMRLFVADISFGNISSSSALSVMSKSSGHEIFISAAFFKTLATVFLDTPQLCAMFRSLNPKLCKRRISRYLIIIVTSFTCIHTNGVYQQYKGNICNRAFKCGSELPEYVALILRNGGSQSPDRWLRELRNNHGLIMVKKQSRSDLTHVII